MRSTISCSETVLDAEVLSFRPPLRLDFSHRDTRPNSHLTSSHSADFSIVQAQPSPTITPAPILQLSDPRNLQSFIPTCISAPETVPTSSGASPGVPPGLWVQAQPQSTSSARPTRQDPRSALLADLDFSSLSRFSTELDSELTAVGSLHLHHTSDFVSGLDSAVSNDADARPQSQFSLSTLKMLGTLGRGGYGKVLLAESSHSGSYSAQVAVKVLTKKYMTPEDVLEVKMEVQVLRMLSRSDAFSTAFLQKMLAAFQTREHVFIIMERHCAPLSHPAFQRQLRLRPHIGSSSSGPPNPVSLTNSVSLPIAFPSISSLFSPTGDALDSLRLLSAELVLGLLFLHAQGIVHQDIKPTNVLVSADGHAVVTDFGSARSMPLSRAQSWTRTNAARRCGFDEARGESLDFSSNSAWTQGSHHSRSMKFTDSMHFGPIILSADDQVSFTRRYAAPELLQSPPWMRGRIVLMYDERVDYYSLGVMLREIALGEVPESRDDQQRWECSSDGAIRGGASLRSELEDTFNSFIDELSAQDPDTRLHGSAVKRHAFLEPLEELWDDIAALRYPPFTDVAWPEADGDIRLDLRAYGGELSEDSLNGLANQDSWSAALADIPHDVEWVPSPSQTPSSPLSCRSRKSSSSSPLVQAVDSDERCHLHSNLQPTELSTDVEPLSFLPSFDSTSFEPLTLPTSDYSPVSEPAPGSDYGRKSPPLRRRQVVHDLRKAFRFAYTIEHPSQSTLACLATSVQKRCLGDSPGPRSRRRMSPRGHGQRPVSATRNWSFEHQITIALLAMMNIRKPQNSPDIVTETRSQRQPSSGRLQDPHQSTSQARRRSTMQSILRKLKGLVS